MRLTVYLVLGTIGVILVVAGVFYVVRLPKEIPREYAAGVSALPKGKSVEELVAEAREKSSNIKGLYMTADVTNDQGAGATRLRNRIVGLAESTEINGIVIDVKEVCGPDYNEAALRKFLEELRQKNIWAIARIVVFKDASRIDTHPEWYLKRKFAKAAGNECARKNYLREKNPDGSKSDAFFWRDRRGGYWLDPASDGARNYILEFSKKTIDLGFDEIQYDYIRFPSDGDVEKAIYPVWDGKTLKYAVMKSFFEFLNKNLKAYKPQIILSADLFGYAAIRAGDVGIGQRLDDIGDNFDYISFMVYPSHYYSGLYLPADPTRNLPTVSLNLKQSRAHLDTIIYRSLLAARDFLDGRIGTTTAASSSAAVASYEIVQNPTPRSQARLRPWLEDFYHENDMAAGRPYGVQKVRMQIDAAQKAEDHGWLLWNAANVYTEGALKKE